MDADFAPIVRQTISDQVRTQLIERISLRGARTRRAGAIGTGALRTVRSGQDLDTRSAPGADLARSGATPGQPRPRRRATAARDGARNARRTGRSQGLRPPALRNPSRARAPDLRARRREGDGIAARRDPLGGGAVPRRHAARRVPSPRPRLPHDDRGGVRQPAPHRAVRQGAQRAVPVGRVRVVALRRGEPRAGRRHHRAVGARSPGHRAGGAGRRSRSDGRRRPSVTSSTSSSAWFTSWCSR